MPLTSEVEIAWARAVARAVDDPAFAERLKYSALETLKSLGTDVEGVEEGDLHPAPGDLSEAVGRFRAAQANAVDAAQTASVGGNVTGPAGSCQYHCFIMCRPTPPACTTTASAPTASQPTASVYTGCYCTASYGTASALPGCYTASAPPGCYTASAPPGCYTASANPACYTASANPACHCTATKPTASGISGAPPPPREEPPQWIGTRPSTGGI